MKRTGLIVVLVAFLVGMATACSPCSASPPDKEQTVYVSDNGSTSATLADAYQLQGIAGYTTYSFDLRPKAIWRYPSAVVKTSKAKQTTKWLNVERYWCSNKSHSETKAFS